MSDIWITSDTHFHHKNIVKGCSSWNDTAGCRNFKSIDQHNNFIVDAINKYVQPDDVLWHLGDWSFGGIDKIWEFRKRLNVQEIHLLLGNHDHHIARNKDLLIPDEDHELAMVLANDFWVEGKDVIVPARELFDSVSYVAEEKFFGHYVFMSHYAHRVWNRSHKGVIHLYGHSHGSLPMAGKSMDVGVDSAKRIFGEYRPFKFQEIQKIMANQPVDFPDHHEPNTN